MINTARLRPLLIVAATLSLMAGAAIPASANGDENVTCSGSFTTGPGFIAPGSYGSLTVEGFCLVAPSGNVTVNRDVIVEEDAALLANYPSFGGPAGLANISVGRNVIVRSGAVLVMGCPNHACTDVISGNVIGDEALGVLVRSTTIGGSVRQHGGGQGVSCEVPKTGFFALIQHPGFSVYEADQIGGNVTIHGYESCWLGVTHSHIGGNVVVVKNNLADPDAIEIIDNTISGNLICHKNSMVWDSLDLVEGALFPRLPQPNTVGGHRVGECVLSSPTTPGGSPGPGPF